MKKGNKLTVIQCEGMTQSYIPVGNECVYIKTYDAYACVFYDGKEMLVNKSQLAVKEEQ